MKIPFSRYSRNEFCSINRKRKERKRNWKGIDWKFILNASLHFQLNSVRVFFYLGGWVKIKYLHLIRWESPFRPHQDCPALVLHWSWNRVVREQACFWEVFSRCFNMNDEVLTKLWTIIWMPVNCLSCLSWLHLAQKRYQPFTIVERKNKRFGSRAIATTRF